MLSSTTKESIILFDMAFYTQVDGVAMGSPLGPWLANAFLCYHQTKWLNDCPKKFKRVSYKRYVDDIFVLFKRPEHVKPFVHYMNSKHKNIYFYFETEKLSKCPFLMSTCSVRMVSFWLIFTEKKHSLEFTLTFLVWFGLIYMLFHRCFCLVSDMSKFHFEIVKSHVDIEVVGTVFIFIFFYKRYFKNLIHKQNKVINTVFNFISILWKTF